MPKSNKELIHCTICNALFLSHVGLVAHLFNHAERGDNVSPGGTETVQIPDDSPESSDSGSPPMEICETEVVQIEVTETILIETTVETSESRSTGGISPPEMEVVDITSSSSEEVIGAEDAADAPQQFNLCLLCRRSFLLPSSLKEHLKRFHGASSPDMETQDASSSSEEAIQAAAPVRRQQQHICIWCGQHFPIELGLRNHLESAHNYGITSLEVQEISSDGANEAAASSEPPREEYRCNACNQTFYTQLDLEDHCKVIHNVELFVCIYCGQPFMWEHLLHAHEIEKHENQPIHRCFVCKKRFVSEIGFQNHRCISEN